ncbi:family 25 glycosyl hydrolase [Lactococcus lactis subsp. lactis]|uniref:GH25 family lysozyme n=1 Tax=Lactococcus lactis TaxID=1358 RepID=UPI00300DE61C
MKLKKSHIIPLILLSGLLIAKPVFAEDNVTQDNLPMGYYIKQEQEQEIAATSQSEEETSSADSVSPRMRSYAAAEPASLAPDDLYSSNTDLPRQDAIDIASYQSWMTQADFNSLKNSGVKTVIIKLTQGTTYLNPSAKNQISMAKNAGLNVATYHFVEKPENIQNEAKFYAQKAKELGLSTNTVMIEDAEAPSQYYNWTAVSQVFKTTMNQAGFNNIRYYTSQGWVSSGVMNASTLGAKNLWVAQYLYGTPSKQNLKNTEYGAWQYTSQMRFQGTTNLKNNYIDTSIDYNNIFNASQGLQDVYRLYNANTGEHFYTLNFAEKTNLQNVGWRYEGIGWLSSSTGSPVYRVYNPNAKGGDHYYTMSKYEAQQLVSKGWRWDNNGGAAFYSNGSKNLYVAYNPNASSGSHNYTTNSYEQDNLLKLGWKYGAVAWKVN